jgi:hypothetical protein
MRVPLLFESEPELTPVVSTSPMSPLGCFSVGTTSLNKIRAPQSPPKYERHSKLRNRYLGPYTFKRNNGENGQFTNIYVLYGDSGDCGDTSESIGQQVSPLGPH